MASRSGSAGGGDAAWRVLSGAEALLLTRLLSVEFAGRDELVAQAKVAVARSIDDNGSIALRVRDRRAADVARRIPVEGELEDDDGVTVHVLLHVVDGFLSELEVYREDSGALLGALVPEDLRLMVL